MCSVIVPQLMDKPLKPSLELVRVSGESEPDAEEPSSGVSPSRIPSRVQEETTRVRRRGGIFAAGPDWCVLTTAFQSQTQLGQV